MKFSHCTSDTKYRLFKSYCMSCYGASLWNFDHPCVQKYWCAWRKCVRQIFRLPPTAHCHLLPGICSDKPIEVQLHSRFVNFFRSCCISPNASVKLCSDLVRSWSSSSCSESLSLVSSLYSFDRCESSRYQYFLPTVAVPAEASAIRDFILFRDACHTADDRLNLQSIIEVLACDWQNFTVTSAPALYSVIVNVIYVSDCE